jgi:hypothetical protein
MTAPGILKRGSCEPFKASVHGAALGLAAVMGVYNAAAWLHRRERHLWINALVYGFAIAFEQKHVAHHIHACRALAADRERAVRADESVSDSPQAA